MIEIFSHDVSVRGDDETEDILIISGKGWEEEPFSIYIGLEDAKTLIWQLSFFVENQ